VALPETGNVISGMGLDFGDMNGGFPDVSIVALQNETFPVYENNGKGGFTEITGKSGISMANQNGKQNDRADSRCSGRPR
jgi:enediyne biosynthesis protein E4